MNAQTILQLQQERLRSQQSLAVLREFERNARVAKYEAQRAGNMTRYRQAETCLLRIAHDVQMLQERIDQISRLLSVSEEKATVVSL